MRMYNWNPKMRKYNNAKMQQCENDETMRKGENAFVFSHFCILNAKKRKYDRWNANIRQILCDVISPSFCRIFALLPRKCEEAKIRHNVNQPPYINILFW
jgi:hypothetical protein